MHQITELFIEKLDQSGKHISQSITGYRAVDILNQVLNELGYVDFANHKTSNGDSYEDRGSIPTR